MPYPKKAPTARESSKQEKESLLSEMPVKKKGTIAYKYDSMAKMNSYDKDMMHERELIYDAKKEIHKEDVAKKKHMHIVNTIAGPRSRG